MVQRIGLQKPELGSEGITSREAITSKGRLKGIVRKFREHFKEFQGCFKEVLGGILKDASTTFMLHGIHCSFLSRRRTCYYYY